MVSSEVVVRDGKCRRATPRAPTSIDTAIRSAGVARRSPCRIIDISSGGARLRLYEILAPGTSIQIALPGRGLVDASIVWADGREAGCRFEPPIDQATIDLVLAKRSAA